MHLLINTVLVYNFEVLHQVFFVFFGYLYFMPPQHVSEGNIVPFAKF